MSDKIDRSQITNEAILSVCKTVSADDVKMSEQSKPIIGYIETSDDNTAKLLHQIAKLQARCAELEKENVRVKTENKALKGNWAGTWIDEDELNQMAKDIESLRAQLSEKERELAELEGLRLRDIRADIVSEWKQLKSEITNSNKFAQDQEDKLAELEKQLAEKEADHKLIMASVERQRDLNDRQSAELKTLREDWVSMKNETTAIATDVQAYIDSTTRFQNGEEEMSETYWTALTLIPSRVRQIIAALKYKGE